MMLFVARSMRTAFMSGTCLVRTAMVSGPMFATLLLPLKLSSRRRKHGLARLAIFHDSAASIAAGPAVSGLTCGRERFAERQMDVERELQPHPNTGVVKIVASDFTDAVETIEHRVAMDA